MFSRIIPPTITIGSRLSATQVQQKRNFRVAVLGASGGIGQPLSLLLKLNPLVTELRLYDVANVIGVGSDLSHIETGAKVTACDKGKLSECISGCDLVVVPAGVPRKPGMSRDDLFNTNANIVKELTEAIAISCPNAFINIISNPVNALVPLASAVLKKAGVYNPKKLFGVTTLDIVRASTFTAEVKGIKNPKEVIVPVIGGHAGTTIIPVLSQATPRVSLSPEETKALIDRIQNGGTEVVQAKAGAGSATLSMAHAGHRFVNSCLRALNSEPNVLEYAYVESNVTDAPFFSTQILIGKNGIEKNLGLGTLNNDEKEMVKLAVADLVKSAAKGISVLK